ncbi:hypothetical protein QAD02_012691 [Eretmocerus hayati]|uniref:Uncharacterized protein n=1 Tax=Eretmocerus hayati TaxID=131215 RepID=A0ACC2P0P5_9HYME|nr:hypothetical protein QAD02_012691 [Eretmocerus hayati]
MSLKKEKNEAGDAERLRAAQENWTGPQLVNDDGISQHGSNDMNPAPDIEQDIVTRALGVRVKHHSNQVTRTKALQECLPPKTVFTEPEVRSILQDMLNISGMSSAGHNNPHQKCQNKTLESKSPQTSLLVTSVTIIESTSLDTGKTWLNPTPQSIRFCRTLRMSMEEESSGAIRNEFDRVEKQKTSLVPYEFRTKDDSDVRLSFHVEHTLFDGEVANELVENSSTFGCPMCFEKNKDYKVSGSHCQAHKGKFLKFGSTLLHAELKMY